MWCFKRTWRRLDSPGASFLGYVLRDSALGSGSCPWHGVVKFGSEGRDVFRLQVFTDENAGLNGVLHHVFVAFDHEFNPRLGIGVVL